MADVARLRALLGSPDAAWLVSRIRERIEGGRDLGGVVTLRDPSEAQRGVVARLFGRPVGSGTSLTVRLGELDALLRRAEICDGLLDGVTCLSGPIRNLRGDRDAEETRWREFFENANTSVILMARSAGGSAFHPSLQTWLDELRALGLLRRLAAGDVSRAETLFGQAMALARRLPAKGVPLAALAADITGDSHALDAGAPLGTLATRLAAALFNTAHDGTVTNRRDVWANAGVLCDELSAPVLVLNLRAGGCTTAARALAAHADRGEPYRLSTRQLLRDAPAFGATLGGGTETVYVCENPTVVAAAANAVGAACAPLVCVEGQPRTAARLLLTQLASSGARLAYHGDFDWGGIRIANVVIGVHGAVPWRYSSVDYRAALGGAPLRGRPVEACWDATLAAAMTERRRAVYEEQVLTDLLGDLADAGRVG